MYFLIGFVIIHLNKVSSDMHKLRSCRRNGGAINLFTFAFYEKCGGYFY